MKFNDYIAMTEDEVQVFKDTTLEIVLEQIEDDNMLGFSDGVEIRVYKLGKLKHTFPAVAKSEDGAKARQGERNGTANRRQMDFGF